MEIPLRLEHVLKQHTRLHGAVLLSLAEFEPWLSRGAPVFFPEYTDHGTDHFRETLLTAAGLIRDEAWPVLTPADAASLVLAVLLHDCAMYVSEDGFLFLLDPKATRATLAAFDDKPWLVLWLDFLSEASRFDGRRLTALFGEPAPVRPPDPSPANWTLRDRLLIGEFLRRQHPRLAHEIALWGVPGPTPHPLRLEGFDQDFRDLAGLIARSHGRPLRCSLDYLRPYDLREYKGVHAVFLMTLLRIADYLQLRSERAPAQLLQVRALRSPLSRAEWNIHQAVRDIRNTHEDPEAIFIDAAPGEVSSYLRARSLFQDLQSELDSSWAILGEIYGRYEGLRRLGLNLRRLRSNLDDEAAFAATVPYVPCHAAFDAAGADLLKLLIRPLYGDRPEIGIRELIQNAVDACLELEDYLTQNPPPVPLEKRAREADVLVTLEGGPKEERYLTVDDSGIGMTADVIRDYFLKAGASFRHSDAWRRRHEAEPGKARVLKSGRFGIGALACFLLGPEIHVSTRHIDVPPEGGIEFHASIDSSHIELQRCTRPVGTTLRIRITDTDVWRHLTSGLESRHLGRPEHSWDWFCLPTPRVLRRLGQQDLKQRYRLPLAGSTLPPQWRRISYAGYRDIHWTYSQAPGLTYNGITVSEGPTAQPLWCSTHIGIASPMVSVFDPDGRLPLVLQRTQLFTPRYPFHEELLADVCRDIVAFALVRAPKGSLEQPQFTQAYRSWHPAVKSVWYGHGAS